MPIGYTDETKKEAFAVASSVPLDAMWERLDSIKKAKLEAKKAQDEVEKQAADLDLHAAYYGVGRVNYNRQTGQMNLVPPPAGQTTMPPIVQGQVGYGMAMQGATPQQIQQAITPSAQTPAAPPSVGANLPAPGALPASGAPVSVPVTSSGKVVTAAATQDPSAAIQAKIQSPWVQNAPPIVRNKLIAGIVAQGLKDAGPSKAEDKLAEETFTSDTDFNRVSGLIGNLVSTLKSAHAEGTAGGPIQGLTGSVKAMLGMEGTEAAKMYDETVNSTALAMAKQLSGGSRGAVTLFQRMLKVLPSRGFTSGQAGSTLAEMFMTAYTLQKAIKDMKLTPEQLDTFSADQLQSLAQAKLEIMSPEDTSRLYDAIGTEFARIQPRKIVNLEGQVSQPGSKTSKGKQYSNEELIAMLKSGKAKIVQ